jgi:PII-like signaling protein
VVEVVDSPERIALLEPFLEQAVAEGLVTLETVQMLRFPLAGR